MGKLRRGPTTLPFIVDRSSSAFAIYDCLGLLPFLQRDLEAFAPQVLSMLSEKSQERLLLHLQETALDST